MVVVMAGGCVPSDGVRMKRTGRRNNIFMVLKIGI